MPTLDSTEMRTGDVVLVGPVKLPSRANMFGQTVLRLRAGRFTRRAKYSHVMLVVEPGVVVHADKGLLRVETLRDFLKDHKVPPRKVRVLRRSRDLTADENLRLVEEANRFIGQPYSFIYGRRSTLFGRALRGAIGRVPARRRQEKDLTLPFCSELVSLAYGAVGISFMGRPSDQTLPFDIEHGTDPFDWLDVTRSYFAGPDRFDAKSHEGVELASVLGQSLTAMNDVVDRYAARTRAEIAGMLKMQFSLFEGEVFVAEVMSRKTEMSLANPDLFLQAHADQVLEDIASVPDVYEWAKGNVTKPSITEFLRFASPTGEETFTVYEGLPSFVDIQRMESELEWTTNVDTIKRLAIILPALVAWIKQLGEDPITSLEPFGLETGLACIETLSPFPQAEYSSIIEGVTDLLIASGRDKSLLDLVERVLMAHNAIAILQKIVKAWTKHGVCAGPITIIAAARALHTTSPNIVETKSEQRQLKIE